MSLKRILLSSLWFMTATSIVTLPKTVLAAGSEGKAISGKQPNKKANSKKSSRPSNVASPQPKGRMSSSEHRAMSDFGVYGEIGLVNILQFGKGVRGAFIMDSQKAIELTFLSSEFSFLGYSTTSNRFSARFKMFAGNSFNLYGGAGVRSLTSVSPGFSGTDSMSATSLTGEFGLGNHWSFGKFAMGCDWVGLSQPLAQLSQSESFESEQTEADDEDDRGRFQSEAANTEIMLVRFFLGMQF